MAKVVEMNEIKSESRKGLRKWNKERIFTEIEKMFKEITAAAKDIEDKVIVFELSDLERIINSGRPENERWTGTDRLVRAGKDWITWFIAEKVTGQEVKYRDDNFKKFIVKIHASSKKGYVAIPGKLVIQTMSRKKTGRTKKN